MEPARVPRCAGFTLIELLVVVVIIGVVFGAVRLSLGAAGPERMLETEAQRLAQLLDLLNDQAALRGTDYGVVVEPAGYRFVHHQQSGWEPIADDRLLRPRELPNGIEITVRIDGFSMPEPAADSDAPQILLLANGDQQDLEIEMTATDTGTSRRLSSDPDSGFGLAPAAY